MPFYIFPDQISTNGYFTFGRTPSGLFNLLDADTYEHYPALVAPYLTHIDISHGAGEILYKVHTDLTSPLVFNELNSFITHRSGVEFHGKWMLVAEWRDVPLFGRPLHQVRVIEI